MSLFTLLSPSASVLTYLVTLTPVVLGFGLLLVLLLALEPVLLSMLRKAAIGEPGQEESQESASRQHLRDARMIHRMASAAETLDPGIVAELRAMASHT